MCQFNLQTLSQRRTQIMGFAMLSVVFFHSGFDLVTIPPLQILKQWGDVGVDMFLLMSGIGIYHSLNHKPNIPSFLKSRLRRILPAHLLVCGCWFLFLDIFLYGEGFLTFLLDVSSLNFWINGRLTTWYLSSLLVMQFLTPIYLRRLEEHPHMDRIAIPVVLLLCLIITYIPFLNEKIGHLLIALYRIPAYLVGLSIGRRICNNNALVSVSVPQLAAIIVVSLGVLVVSSGLTPLYLRWVLRYAAYLPIAIMICIGVTFLPENKVFRYFGMHSLEVYLLHEKVLWVFSALATRIIPGKEIHSVVVNILAIVVTCVGANILHAMLSFKTKRKGARNFA